MNIDLKQFVQKPGSLREYLERPLSKGDFSYATNGHIMVRVARLDDVAEVDKAGAGVNFDGPLAGNADAAYGSPLPLVVPPPAEPEHECMVCDGSLTAHSCPSCTCPCTECDGTGVRRPERSITVGKAAVDLDYMLQVLALPNVRIATDAAESGPIQFQFDGGIGAVMPLRSPRADHVGKLKFRKKAA